MKSISLRSLRLGLATIALVGLTAACGSTAETTSTSAAASSSVTAADPAAAAAQWQKFVGGKLGAADSTKSPVVVGVYNSEGGVPSFPEGSLAAEATANFVNEQLGGVGGHPLELQICKVANGDEQAQGCAQQFLNDDTVVGVLEIQGALGSQVFHNTMAGKKPVVIVAPGSPADAAAENGYGIGSGIFGTIPAFVTYATGDLQAKKVSLIYPGDDPTGQVAAQLIAQGVQAAGAELTQAPYKSTTTDLLPTVTAANATSADAVIALLPTTPTCVAGAKALEQAGVTAPVVALGLCSGQDVKKNLGDLPAWNYVFGNVSADLPDADPYAAAAVSLLQTEQATDTPETGGMVVHSVAGVMALAKFINDAGPDAVTPDSLKAKIAEYTGEIPLLAPGLKFGSVPDMPALGTIATRVYTYSDTGEWSDATGGKWIGG